MSDVKKITPEHKNEIATTRDGRDITRGYVDSLPLLPNTDRLLALKGGGDLLIYQEVARDEQVKACFEQRVRAVISKPWEVRPGGDKTVDKQAAEFIKAQMDGINFDSITEKMLWGVFYGYAVAEALYAVEGGKVVLDTERSGIKVRNRRRFGFAPDFSLRLRTTSNPLGEVLPDKKFWHFATGSDNDDEPYGIGLAHWLYWPVFFKRSDVKFWMVFLEKFGSPTAVGKYPNGTSEDEQNKLLASLQAIQTDSAIIFPDGMNAELLEATRGGTADYTELYDKMNNAIAKVIIGQTASTQGTPGKLGNDKLQAEVRADIVKADADLVCMSLNATIIRWLVEWNFPGAAVPQVWRKCEEEDDQNKLSERDERISKIGFRPTLKYVHETYGGEWVETQPSPTAALLPAGEGSNSAQFAESDIQFSDQVALDAAIAQLPGSAIDAAMRKTLETVVQHLTSGASADEALAILSEAYPDMDSSAMEEQLARAFFVADLWGQLNAS